MTASAVRRSARRALVPLLACLAPLALGRAARAQPTPNAPPPRLVAWPVTAGQPAAEWPARLQPAARSALDALADSARAAGLPLQPLYDKAAEGVLKRADDARIVIAVRTLARELGAARDALGPGASAAEVVTGASAMHAGLSRESLRALVHARGTRGASLALSFAMVADLVARGVPPDVAVDVYGALLTRGAPDAELVALRQGIERDIAAGSAPASAARTRVRAVNPRP